LHFACHDAARHARTAAGAANFAASPKVIAEGPAIVLRPSGSGPAVNFIVGEQSGAWKGSSDQEMLSRAPPVARERRGGGWRRCWACHQRRRL